ncbi:hypothetical protein Tco_1433265, partial [Tanacetum coccineum]
MTRSSTESKTSHAVAANLSELELKKILIDKMESNKSIHRSDEQKNLYKALVEAYESDKLILDTYDWGSKRRRARKEGVSTSAPKEKTSKTSGKSHEGSKYQYKTASESAQPEEPMHTAKDLEEPTNQEFKTGGTKDQPDEETSQHPYCSLAQKVDPRELFNELMDTPLDFSAFSLIELEYLFKEVYKATTDQLDWINPEGQQYPHDLRKTLPLIPNSRASVIKTKATDYGHIKWIEDLVPNRMWSQVLSKRRIIVVTKLEIVDWHNYKHLDWITVCRDDDRLYKFKEGDFNRLCIQDIKDMLLLLVQGKLTNLTVEKRLAFNVSLRMFTRSVVIQRRVEDLQLGVESYQKKLNLTKPDTYRPDLKRREAYTSYSTPR